MRKIITENDHVRFESLDDIIIAILKVDLIDLSVVKNIVELRLNMTADLVPYPFIVNIKNVKNSTKEVRDFLASAKAAERVTVTALLIDSMVSATIGNFFLRISRPPVPTKIFTTEEDAVEWLNQKTEDLKK